MGLLSDDPPVEKQGAPEGGYQPYIDAALAAARERADCTIEPRAYFVGRLSEDYTGELRDHVVVDVVYDLGGHRALYGFDRDDPDTIGLWED